MDKCYWQRSVLCPKCGYFRPAGPRPESKVDPNTIWQDACHNYGYILYDDLPPADDCEGFAPPEQVKIRQMKTESGKRKRVK